MKLYVHSRVIVIGICIKFHKIIRIGYLVMANFIDFKTIQGNNSGTTKASLTKLSYSEPYLFKVSRHSLQRLLRYGSGRTGIKLYPSALGEE